MLIPESRHNPGPREIVISFENFALATPPTAFGYWGVLTSIDQPTSVKWEAVLSTIEGLV